MWCLNCDPHLNPSWLQCLKKHTCNKNNNAIELGWTKKKCKNLTGGWALIFNCFLEFEKDMDFWVHANKMKSKTSG